MHVENHPAIHAAKARPGSIIIADRPLAFRQPSSTAIDPSPHYGQRRVASRISAALNGAGRRAAPLLATVFDFPVRRPSSRQPLTIPREESPARFPVIELAEQPKRIYSNFIHGSSDMKVRIPQ